MRIVFLTIIIFGYICNSSYAQGELGDNSSLYKSNESTFAGQLYTNGLGICYQYGGWVDGYKKNLYNAGFRYIKHPKEIKMSLNGAFSNRFVYGKMYSPIGFSFGYGRQKELFSKFYISGISIKRYFLIGAIIEMLKPVYYDVFEGSIFPSNSVKLNQDNVDDYYNKIAGKSSFFKGFGEMKVIPGVYAKAAISFEYSPSKYQINAVDAGVCTEAFYKQLPIMATDENNWLFISFYVSLRYGKVFSPRLKNVDNKNIL